MVSQANIYYLDIVHTIDPAIPGMWDDDIKAAEWMRLTDIKVMNIYAAQLPDHLGVDPALALASALASALTEQWMEFAILMEETQYSKYSCL